jgi:hypothetical protein
LAVFQKAQRVLRLHASGKQDQPRHE